MAGFTSLKESVEKIIHPGDVNYSIITLVIVAVAVLVKFFLGKYVKSIGKRIDSQSLIASGTDAFFDSVVSASTLITAIINIVWNIILEGYVGVIISALIIKSGVGILKETLNTMIGLRADSYLSKQIKDCINSFEDVEGTYDLILHSYGPSRIIGATNIQVDENMTAKEIHSLTKKIQNTIYDKFEIILTIGIYASNDSDDAIRIKEELKGILDQYVEIKQLHGFYLDEDEKNISFDVVIDFSADNPQGIKEEIVGKIKTKYPEYNYSVVVDSDYSD